MRLDTDVYPAWDETADYWSVPSYSLRPGELLHRLGPDPPTTDEESFLLTLVSEVRIFGSGTPYTLSQPITDAVEL